MAVQDGGQPATLLLIKFPAGEVKPQALTTQYDVFKSAVYSALSGDTRILNPVTVLHNMYTTLIIHGIRSKLQGLSTVTSRGY